MTNHRHPPHSLIEPREHPPCHRFCCDAEEHVTLRADGTFTVTSRCRRCRRVLDVRPDEERTEDWGALGWGLAFACALLVIAVLAKEMARW